MAIPKKDIKLPGMPMADFIAEAESLYATAKIDQPFFEKIGFTETAFIRLNELTDLARHVQSLWGLSRDRKKEGRLQWSKAKPTAYEFRNELIRTFRYAFRKNKQLLSRVSAIADRSGDADMIQDLNDLSVLGKSNLPLLENINFDPEILNKAAQLSDSLSELLGKVKFERFEESEEKLMRNRAYTLLKETVDEIREAGKYIFAKNKKRSKAYASDYFRRMWKKNQSKKT